MTRTLNALIGALLVLVAVYSLVMNANRYTAARGIVTAINSRENAVDGLYASGRRYREGTPEVTVEMMKVFNRWPESRTVEHRRMALATAHTAERIDPDNWQVTAALMQLYASMGRNLESSVWRERTKLLAPYRFR